MIGKELLDDYTVKWHAPIRYAKRGGSGLTLTVDGATDDAIVELTWNGGKPFTKEYR